MSILKELIVVLRKINLFSIEKSFFGFKLLGVDGRKERSFREETEKLR
jgi:hypothetical protein